MKLSRVKISSDATFKLRSLQAKTGLTPNILLRIGFGLSLQEKAFLDPALYPQDGQELNRYTLTGEYDAGFLALLKVWLDKSKINANEETAAEYFRAHLNRGAIALSSRVKSIVDLGLIK